MAAHNYKVPTSYTGSYNCRGITGCEGEMVGPRLAGSHRRKRCDQPLHAHTIPAHHSLGC